MFNCIFNLIILIKYTLIRTVILELILILVLFKSNEIKAQEFLSDHYSVGILPVTSAVNEGNRYTPSLEALVSKVFVEKSRFTVVDRTQIDKVLNERNLQKQEDFLNGAVVEQGKSLGAQFLISGNLNQLSKRSGNVEKSKIEYDYATQKVVSRKYSVYVYQIDLGMNVQIIDVATGIVKSNKNFSVSVETETTSEGTAISNAIHRLNGYLKAWINEAFPVQMKVVRIESATKKGIPEKLLIKGGKDMDLSVDKGILVNNSSELDVIENEVLEIDGKPFTRSLIVGKVKIEEVQGEFSICKVKKGAEEILKKINEGKTLILKINKY